MFDPGDSETSHQTLSPIFERFNMDQNSVIDPPELVVGAGQGAAVILTPEEQDVFSTTPAPAVLPQVTDVKKSSWLDDEDEDDSSPLPAPIDETSNEELLVHELVSGSDSVGSEEVYSTEEESTEDDEEDKEEAVLQVYSKNCVSCKELVTFAEVSHKAKHKCHFTQGNEDCPAQDIKITLHVPIDMYVRGLLNAERNNDSVKLAKRYAQVAKMDEWVQSRVFKELEVARNNS